jgi:hypothetical protein
MRCTPSCHPLSVFTLRLRCVRASLAESCPPANASLFSTSRLLSHTFTARVLNPAILPPALHAIRRAIFPDDALGPARVPPSEDEVVAIKRECARVIVEVVPPHVRAIFFATGDVTLMRNDVEGTLDLFADSYLNKHLIVNIVELIFLRLFPEISEER